MSGWGCGHEIAGRCTRLDRACDPGMAGCILHGRFRFTNPAKNRPQRATADGETGPDRIEGRPSQTREP